MLFLSDIFPTGYMAAEKCDIKPGDMVAVWGCGPVGQFAIKSAFLLGAERVIAIDRFPYRCAWRARKAGAETLDYEEVDILERCKEMTGGRGPTPASTRSAWRRTAGVEYAYDRVKQDLLLETDRPIALREAIMACRNGGIVSVIGVYGGLIDKFPIGAVMNRSLTIKTGQTHVQRYMHRCWSGSRTARSTRASSSRIACAWTRRPKGYRCSTTSRTSASRSSSSPSPRAPSGHQARA